MPGQFVLIKKAFTTSQKFKHLFRTLHLFGTLEWQEKFGLQKKSIVLSGLQTGIVFHCVHLLT